MDYEDDNDNDDDDQVETEEIEESSFIPDKSKKPRKATTPLSTHRSPKDRAVGGDDVAPVSRALNKLDVHDEMDEDEVEDVEKKSKSKGLKKEKVEREKSKGSRTEKVEREKSKGSRTEKVERETSKGSKKEKVLKDDTPTSPKNEKTEKAVKADKDPAPASPKKEKAVKADKDPAPVSPKKEKAVKADKDPAPVSPKKEKAAKADKAAAPKSPKKEKQEKAVDDSSDAAPPKLVQKVMELGMEPLYAYLIEKLDAFKENRRYKSNAEDWGLIKMPHGKLPREEDLALITPEQLYANFMSNPYSDGTENFQSFLMYECDDRVSWGCMANFEQMKKENTSYVTFMKLFQDIIVVYKRLPIATKGSEKDPLEKLYDKCQDKDLKAARKKF